MDDDAKRRLKMMLRRIQGQVGGVERMLGNDDKSVEDILTQISAAMSSLKSVGRALSVEEAIKLGLDERRRDKYDRLIKRLM